MNYPVMFRSVLPVKWCNFVLYSDISLISKMSTWSSEKNKYINMTIQDKRRNYKVKSHITIENIPSWDFQFASQSKPLERDIQIFGNFKINAELNKQICKKVSLWKGDITTLEIDSIVNAANSKLQGGGGVDGAIHRAAGPLLLAECKDLKGCPTGEAKITGGYLLPAKYVIHTVGPTDKSHDKLIKCYKNCFALQKENKLKSIAFPCIGTGIYNFPNVDAAHIACGEARKFLEDDIISNGGIVNRIIFCLFETKDIDIYNSVTQLYFPLE